MQREREHSRSLFQFVFKTVVIFGLFFLSCSSTNDTKQPLLVLAGYINYISVKLIGALLIQSAIVDNRICEILLILLVGQEYKLFCGSILLNFPSMTIDGLKAKII